MLLIPPLRDLVQGLSRPRLLGEGQSRAEAVDLLERLAAPRPGLFVVGQADVGLFLRHRAAADQLGVAIGLLLRQLLGGPGLPQPGHGDAEAGDLVVDVGDRRSQLPAIGTGGGDGRLCLGDGLFSGFLRHVQGRLRLTDPDFLHLIVQDDEQVSLLHHVVVIHADLAHVLRDPRRDLRGVRVDISVVGQHGRQRQLDLRIEVVGRGGQSPGDQDDRDQATGPTAAAGRRMRGRRRSRRAPGWIGPFVGNSRRRLVRNGHAGTLASPDQLDPLNHSIIEYSIFKNQYRVVRKATSRSPTPRRCASPPRPPISS